ncbi:MAG: DsrE family protein [Nitriliruptoraceae bacterium]|nr:DsrE family protein [Nitriliruptoraceae bacterium]
MLEPTTDTLLFPVSHGADEPERATVPFVVAATAIASGRPALVIATVEGVTLGLPEVADGIEEDGFPPLADLQHQLAAGGGALWLCSACATKRGITGDRALVPGATIVGAARIVEALSLGRAMTLS